MICKYILQFCGLSVHSFVSVLRCIKTSGFKSVSLFSFVASVFGDVFKKLQSKPRSCWFAPVLSLTLAFRSLMDSKFCLWKNLALSFCMWIPLPQHYSKEWSSPIGLGALIGTWVIADAGVYFWALSSVPLVYVCPYASIILFWSRLFGSSGFFETPNEEVCFSIPVKDPLACFESVYCFG